MQVRHEALFYQMLSVYTPDYKITEQEIEFLKTVDVQTIETNSKSVNVSKNINLLDTHPELKNIRDVMFDVAERYKNDVYGISNELSPLHNWVATQHKGGQHHRHTHPNSIMSIVYYIKGSENAQFEIDMGNGKSRLTEAFNFSFNYTTSNGFNSTMFNYQPKDGEILCVPGWLSHGTTVSEGFRMCIGWDFFINGVIGTHSHDRMKITTEPTRLDNDK